MTRSTIANLLACATMLAAALPLMVATETVNGSEWNYTDPDGKAEIMV